MVLMGICYEKQDSIAKIVAYSGSRITQSLCRLVGTRVLVSRVCESGAYPGRIIVKDATYISVVIKSHNALSLMRFISSQSLVILFTIIYICYGAIGFPSKILTTPFAARIGVGL